MQTRAADLTKKFSPFRPSGRIGIPDQPVFITLPNMNALWCVVFSEVDALKASMDFMGIEEYKIKQVQDGQEFAESLLASGKVRLMLDPRVDTTEGKTKWTEIVLG